MACDNLSPRGAVLGKSPRYRLEVLLHNFLRDSGTPQTQRRPSSLQCGVQPWESAAVKVYNRPHCSWLTLLMLGYQ